MKIMVINCNHNSLNARKTLMIFIAQIVVLWIVKLETELNPYKLVIWVSIIFFALANTSFIIYWYVKGGIDNT